MQYICGSDGATTAVHCGNGNASAGLHSQASTLPSTALRWALLITKHEECADLRSVCIEKHEKVDGAAGMGEVYYQRVE